MINDGSIDNSFDICLSYTLLDPRFKVFNKDNGGISSARNFGLSKLVGNYVVFVDSDDYISPFYLKSYMDRLGINDTDLICQDYVNDF